MLSLFDRSPVSEIQVAHAGETYRIALRRVATTRRYTLRVRAASRDVLLTMPARGTLKAAKEFAVYYERGAGHGDSYLVNHSRTVYLMGPKGEPIALLPADKGPDAVADEIVKWVK